MENQELLLAISDMMDKKMDSIHVRMDNFDNKLDVLDKKIDGVEERLSAEILRLDVKIDGVEERLNTKIDTIEDNLRAEMKKTNIAMEHVVIPRINHIEQCYLTTSERYINETGRINGLVADVQVIKSVVLDHSEKLQKIS